MLIPFNTTLDRRGRPIPGLWERYGIKPKGIIHVGGNRGEEAPCYLELGVTKQFWYEPNPEMFERLRETLKGNKQAIAFNHAIGDVDSVPVTLHIANNSGQSSSVLELGTHKQQHPDVHYIRDIQVTMRRLDSLIFSHEIVDFDFLNADVQGFEGQVLVGMGELIHSMKWLYLEVNKAQVYTGCWEVAQIDRYLFDRGFTRVETKWIGDWGDALYIRK